MTGRQLYVWGFALGLDHTPENEREEYVRLMTTDDPEELMKEKRQDTLDKLAGIPGGNVVRPS